MSRWIYKFRPYRSVKDGKWYVSFIAKNEEVLFTNPQGYERRGKCLAAIEILQKHAATAVVEFA